MVDGAILTVAALAGGADPELPVEFVRIDRSVACSEHGALELTVRDVEAGHFEVMLDAVAGGWCNGLGRLYCQPYPLEQGGLFYRGHPRVSFGAVLRVHPRLEGCLGSKRVDVMTIFHNVNSRVSRR